MSVDVKKQNTRACENTNQEQKQFTLEKQIENFTFNYPHTCRVSVHILSTLLLVNFRYVQIT